MLEDPVNGRVVYSSTVVGSQAQYYCNLGYELLSDRETTRTCVSVHTTDRAVWTSDIPICRGICDRETLLCFILRAVGTSPTNKETYIHTNIHTYRQTDRQTETDSI